MNSAIGQIQERIREAARSGVALYITGGGTRNHLARAPAGEPLATRALHGIFNYQPTELAVTVGAGTPVEELERTLAAENQMLAFEPPLFGPASTVGGMVASGLSGPRRPFAGALRDALLGVRIIDGQGEYLHFGGEVMKNVAGYDVSRLMAGSWGTLGVIVEASFKVLPRPEVETTQVLEKREGEAIETMQQLAARPLPISAMSFQDGLLRVRLSGDEAAVTDACATIGGEAEPDHAEYWKELRHLRSSFFQGDQPLWRCSLPPATPPLALAGDQLIDWGGAQRWVRSTQPAAEIRRICTNAGGHATLFQGGDREGDVFPPLPPVLRTLHQRLKQAFDPYGILNPGRMYREF